MWRGPARIAGAYLAFALVWIWTTDLLLARAELPPALDFWFDALKGSVFVTLSAALVFGVAWRELRSVARTDNLLRALADNTTDAVFVKDAAGRYLFINESAARFAGKSAAELVGRDDTALFDPESARLVMEIDRGVMAGGRPQSREEILTAAGVTRTYLVMKAPFRDERGEVVGLVGISRDITDRKEVERRVQAERDRFELIVEAAPVVICSYELRADGSTRFPYAGPRIERLFGFTPHELAEDASVIYRVVHPDDAALLRESILESARTLSVWRAEFRVRSPELGEIWVEGCSAPVRRPDGSIVWHGYVADVTERERMQRALREEEERLKEAQRIARLGSWRWDEERDRLWWSDGCYELFGRDPALGPPTFDEFTATVHPEDRRVAAARVDAVRAGADHFAAQFRVVHPDGRTLWIRSEARATRDPVGQLVHLDGIDQDVTERRQAEAALRESEERFRTLVDHATDAILLLADDGAVLDANHAAGEMLGYSRDELLALHVGDFDVEITPERRAGLERRFADGRSAAFDTRNKRKDGSTFPVEVRVRPLEIGGRRCVLAIVRDITERKRAEDELRQERDRFALLAATSPGLLHSFRRRPDGTTHFPYLSPGVGEIYGGEPDALARDAEFVAERIHPVDREAVREATHRSARDLTPYQVEFRYRHPARGEIWLRVHTRPVREADGSTLWHGFVLDVTDRRRSEQALRESEARFRRVFENAATGIAISDAVGRLLQCNPAYCAILGRDEDELRDRPFNTFVHPDDQESNRREIHRVLNQEAVSVELENRYVRRDGAVAWSHKFVSALLDDRGSPAHLIALVTDVTERRRAEQALRESEARFRMLVDVLPDAVYMAVAGRMVFCNPACVRLFGAADAARLVGKTDFELIHPDHHAALLERDASGDDAAVHRRTFEAKIVRLDQRATPVYVTAVPLPDASPPTVLVVLDDLSERRRLEEQFRQSQKMEAVGRLAGGVAHDFNNLLTVINGYTDLMLAETAADHAHRAPLAAIQEAGERAAALTSQLLSFSRKAIVEPRVLDLNQVVAQSEKLLRRLIGEDVALKSVLSSEPCRVVADPTQVDQVIMNLAVNARDAMPTGGRLTIETRLARVTAEDAGASGEPRPGRYVELLVRDTGAGIPDDMKPRLFEPFFTTKGPGKGTGLGLAVVHGVVKQSGGHVFVDSQLGVGTTFRILLPEAPSPEPDDSSGAPPAAGRGRETVLLVEDEDAVRSLARLALESQGYRVIVARGGRDAIAEVERRDDSIDLLVTDVVMPEMSGRELADAVRAKRPGVRVLFVSGYTDDAVLRHGVREAADAFLQKPFTPLGLARKVRAVLDEGA